MSALNQYLDLYESNKELIDSKSAPLLNALRPKAAEALQTMRLPARGSEDYELTDLKKMLAPDFGVNIARVNLPVDPARTFRCDVPHMSTTLFMLVNDKCAETDTTRRGLPEGVLAGSLRDIAESHPDLLAPYFGHIAPLSNPVVALNSMLAQDGFVLYVPRGVRIEKTIQLVDILSHEAPLMAVRRLLIIMEADSAATLLICDHTQNTDVHLFNLQTIEVFVGAGAKLDIYDLEESSTSTSRLSAMYIKQEQDSNVLVDSITLYNGCTRNEYHCSLDGRGARLRLLGMGIEDDKRHLDTYSRISHNVPDCTTDELFKYVVDDEATGAFTGRIYVAKGASGTEAYQSNRNLVGSDTARMHSKPQLEIYNDDVKCSHGTAIGQLDPMQVFYMRTRGLSEAKARLLLKQAFMADVLDGIREESLRDRLRHLVERRFAGDTTPCTSCGAESCRH